MATYNIDFEKLVLDAYFGYDYRGYKIINAYGWSKDIQAKYETDTESYFENKTTKDVITDNYDFVEGIFSAAKSIREIDLIIDYKIMQGTYINYSDVVINELLQVICEFIDWEKEESEANNDDRIKSYRINDTETVWKDTDDTMLRINNVKIPKSIYTRLASLGLCYCGI